MGLFSFSPSSIKKVRKLQDRLQQYHYFVNWKETLEWEAVQISSTCLRRAEMYGQAPLVKDLFKGEPHPPGPSLSSDEPCSVKATLERALERRRALVQPQLERFDAELSALEIACGPYFTLNMEMVSRTWSFQGVCHKAYREAAERVHLALPEMSAAYLEPADQKALHDAQLKVLLEQYQQIFPSQTTTEGTYLELLTTHSLWEQCKRAHTTTLFVKVQSLMAVYLRALVKAESEALEEELLQRSEASLHNGSLTHSLELLHPMSPLLAHLFPKSVILPNEHELKAAVAQYQETLKFPNGSE